MTAPNVTITRGISLTIQEEHRTKNGCLGLAEPPGVQLRKRLQCCPETQGR